MSRNKVISKANCSSSSSIRFEESSKENCINVVFTHQGDTILTDTKIILSKDALRTLNSMLNSATEAGFL